MLLSDCVVCQLSKAKLNRIIVRNDISKKFIENTKTSSVYTVTMNLAFSDNCMASVHTILSYTGTNYFGIKKIEESAFKF